MKNNINRVQKYIEALLQVGDFLQSCWAWKSKIRSIVAFIVSTVIFVSTDVDCSNIVLVCNSLFEIVTYFFTLYAVNLVTIADTVGSRRHIFR